MRFGEVCDRIGFPMAVAVFFASPQGRGEVQNLKRTFDDWLSVLLFPGVEPDLAKAVLEKMREVGKFPDWIAAVEKLQGSPREVSLGCALGLARSFEEAYEVFQLSSREARGKTPGEMAAYYLATGGQAVWQKAFKDMTRLAKDFEQYHKIFQQAVQLCDGQTEQRFAEKMKKGARSFAQKYRALQALSIGGYPTERAEILEAMKEGGTLEDWAMVRKLAVPDSELSKLASEKMAEFVAD